MFRISPIPALRRHPHICVLFLFALLAPLATFPLALHFADQVPGHGMDDPYLVWNLWWVKYALLDLGRSPLFTDYIFYPIGVNLASYTLTTLNGLVSIPLQLAWGVVPANNLVVLAAPVLAAFGAYLAALDLLRSDAAPARAGAIAAGLIYGFASYRYTYLDLGHMNFNSNEWLPYYVLFLQRSLDGRGRVPRAGLLAGLFLVLTGWTESTFTAFLALLTVGYLVFWLCADRSRLFHRSVAANLAALAGVTVAGLLPLLLALIPDFTRYGDFLLRGSGGAEFLSADLLSFFIPSEHHPLLGVLSQGLAFHNSDFAFVGYVTLALALVGVQARRARGEFAFWAITALLSALVMLGPVLHVANQTPLNFLPLPFSLLQSIPLLRANRLPVRYDHLLMLALALLAARGLYVFLLRRPHPRAWMVALPALLVLEHLGAPLSLSDLSVPAIYRTIAAQPGDFSVLDLPLSWSTSTLVQGQLYTQSQFYQSVHHKRLLGGNTSRTPPFYFQYFNELPIIHSLILLENGETVDPGVAAAEAQYAPELVRFFNLRYVTAQPGRTGTAVLDYVRRVLPLTPLPSNGLLAFRVTVPPSPALVIDPAQPIARMYFDDNWGRPQAGPDGSAFRWATGSGASVFAPLSPANYQMCGTFAGARDGQSVQVTVNGLPAGRLTLTTQWARHCISLPARLLGDGLDTLAFESTPVPLRQVAFPEDRRIGQTGVTAPADIAVTSAGFLAGKFASLTFGGREVYETRRGYTLMAIDPAKARIVAVQRFDTFRDESQSVQMAGFIAGLPAGTIVAGAVSDDASRHLTAAAVDALHTLGLTLDLRTRFRLGHAFVGVKGAAPGTGLEDSNLNFPANVSVGKNVTAPDVTFALGVLEFNPAP